VSYITIEDGLSALINGLSNYNNSGTSQNLSQGDYRILGRGLSRAVILQPGSIREREVAQSPRRMRTVWDIYVELYIPFTGEMSTIATALRTDRQELLDHLDKYPTLNGITGVIHAMIVRGDEPRVWVGESGNWWRQVLNMSVEERVTVTIAE